jgi:hypothetical protein
MDVRLVDAPRLALNQKRFDDFSPVFVHSFPRLLNPDNRTRLGIKMSGGSKFHDVGSVVKECSLGKKWLSATRWISFLNKSLRTQEPRVQS